MGVIVRKFELLYWSHLEVSLEARTQTYLAKKFLSKKIENIVSKKRITDSLVSKIATCKSDIVLVILRFFPSEQQFREASLRS